MFIIIGEKKNKNGELQDYCILGYSKTGNSIVKGDEYKAKEKANEIYAELQREVDEDIYEGCEEELDFGDNIAEINNKDIYYSHIRIEEVYQI